MEHNNPVTVTESSNADMLCKVYGDPQPTVYWSKISGGSENDISIGNYFTSNSTLFVVNSTATSLSVSRQDAGVYNCYANNSLGAVSQNITVVVHCKFDCLLLAFFSFSLFSLAICRTLCEFGELIEILTAHK